MLQRSRLPGATGLLRSIAIFTVAMAAAVTSADAETPLGTVEEMSSQDVAAMGSMCAWAECVRHIPSTEMQPPDWHNLIVYWSPFPDVKKTLAEIVTGPACYRDAVLCPEHAKALDGLLKDIGQALSEPPAGTA